MILIYYLNEKYSLEKVSGAWHVAGEPNSSGLKRLHAAGSPLQGWKQVCDALHVIIRHHPLPLCTAALLMGLSIGQSAHPSEGEEGLQAAVRAQHDVCVEAVAHHQTAFGVHAELGGHAVEHVVIGLAHCLGPALGCRLNGLQQAACTWEEEEGSHP